MIFKFVLVLAWLTIGVIKLSGEKIDKWDYLLTWTVLMMYLIANFWEVI